MQSTIGAQRPWFLKRWIVNPFTKIDWGLFDKYATSPYLSAGLIVYTTLVSIIILVALATVCTTGGAQAFRETAVNIAVGVAAYYVVRLLRQNFTSIPRAQVRVWRALYILLILGISFVVALMLIPIAVYLASGGLVLWVGFFLVTGGSLGSRGKDALGRRVYKLDNGVVLTETTGALGETSWRGSDGFIYERTLGGRFIEM